MGWSFAYSRSFGKKELVAELRDPIRFGEHQTLLRSSVVGNHHWFLMHNAETGRTIIGLDLMQSGGKTEGWGYKSMSEHSGPYVYDCPLSFLAEASEATGYAIEWREKVRAHHAAKKARPVPAAGLEVDVFGRIFRLTAPAGLRRGWLCVEPATGNYYRLSAANLAKATLPKESAPC